MQNNNIIGQELLNQIENQINGEEKVNRALLVAQAEILRNSGTKSFGALFTLDDVFVTDSVVVKDAGLYFAIKNVEGKVIDLISTELKADAYKKLGYQRAVIEKTVWADTVSGKVKIAESNVNMWTGEPAIEGEIIWKKDFKTTKEANLEAAFKTSAKLKAAASGGSASKSKVSEAVDVREPSSITPDLRKVIDAVKADKKIRASVESFIKADEKYTKDPDNRYTKGGRTRAINNFQKKLQENNLRPEYYLSVLGYFLHNREEKA